MNFQTKAVFYSHTITEKEKKDGTGKFWAGDAIFEVDNSYDDKRTGSRVIKMDLVPFNLYGATAQKVLTYIAGTECNLTFSIGGRGYNGRQYPEIKGVFVHRVEGDEQAPAPAPAPAPKAKADDIPF